MHHQNHSNSSSFELEIILIQKTLTLSHSFLKNSWIFDKNSEKTNLHHLGIFFVCLIMVCVAILLIPNYLVCSNMYHCDSSVPNKQKCALINSHLLGCMLISSLDFRWTFWIVKTRWCKSNKKNKIKTNFQHEIDFFNPVCFLGPVCLLTSNSFNIPN